MASGNSQQVTTLSEALSLTFSRNSLRCISLVSLPPLPDVVIVKQIANAEKKNPSTDSRSSLMEACWPRLCQHEWFRGLSFPSENPMSIRVLRDHQKQIPADTDTKIRLQSTRPYVSMQHDDLKYSKSLTLKLCRG